MKRESKGKEERKERKRERKEKEEREERNRARSKSRGGLLTLSKIYNININHVGEGGGGL